VESGPPPTSTDTGLVRDPSRIGRAAWGRRALVVVLAVFLAIAATGAFDPSEEEASASGGGYELEVSYPSTSRGGLDTPLRIRVRRPGGFEGPVELAVRNSWLDIFDQEGIEPEPSSSTADPDRVIWEFDPPPGEELEVRVTLSLRPAVRSGEQGSISVLEQGRDLATVEFDTRVVP
jgi:hypothetical protein